MTQCVSAAGLPDAQQQLLRANINYFNIDACSVAAPAPTVTSTPGSIPAGGKDVGASEFTDAQGYHSDALNGTYSYAELSPPGTAAVDVKQETATNLGGLAYKQKVAITYQGKTVVAEKLDIGQGGGDINGKSRDIDLHFDKTAQALGITDSSSWSGVVHVQEVVDKTPLGPVSDPSTLVDSNSSTATTPAPVSGGGCCSASASTTLTGNDNEEKVWNYFKGKGLSDTQVAGIMGNIQQESSFDPELMEIGGHSKNPYDASTKGWGLIQWSGNTESTGDKFTRLFKESGLSGPVYELSTQLDLVWQHLNNHPVVTQTFDLNHFKAITDPREAATYFESQIEGGTDPGGVRENNAATILTKYGGTGSASPASPSTSTSDCAAGSASSSPDCTTAPGDPKILCEAKKYDPVDYVWGGGHAGGSAYHAACPTIKANDSSCGLDCSGLVSVAVYDAFGNNTSWDTNSLRSDGTNWKEVMFNQLQPGDVIEPDSGHVEIIDHVQGSTINTFGGHTDKVAQPDQVGPTTYTTSPGDGYRYFHYVGQGSS
jgi:hypothetical protein